MVVMFKPIRYVVHWSNYPHLWLLKHYWCWKYSQTLVVIYTVQRLWSSRPRLLGLTLIDDWNIIIDIHLWIMTSLDCSFDQFHCDVTIISSDFIGQSIHFRNFLKYSGIVLNHQRVQFVLWFEYTAFSRHTPLHYRTFREHSSLRLSGTHV